MQRRRLGVLVAGAAGTAMLSLLAMVVEQAVGGGRDPGVQLAIGDGQRAAANGGLVGETVALARQNGCDHVAVSSLNACDGVWSSSPGTGAARRTAAGVSDNAIGLARWHSVP